MGYQIPVWVALVRPAFVIRAMATKLQTQKADWHAVERDYRAGLLSLREVGKLHGVSHVRIQAVAAENGWQRNLTAKIQAKADEIVQRREVIAMSVQDERAVIDANAQVIANVRSEHRQDIRRARAIAGALMAELEVQTFDMVLMSELGTLMRNPNEDGMDKLSEIYRKVISMPGRVDTAKKLIETMKSVIGMEREAYGIDSTPAEVAQNGIAAFLAGMKRSALPVVYEVEPDDSL